MKVKTGKCIIIHLCVPSYLDQCHGYAGILTSARVSSYPDQYHRYQRYQRYAGTLTSVRGMQVHWPVVMHKVVFTYILNLWHGIFLDASSGDSFLLATAYHIGDFWPGLGVGYPFCWMNNLCCDQYNSSSNTARLTNPGMEPSLLGACALAYGRVNRCFESNIFSFLFCKVYSGHDFLHA